MTILRGVPSSPSIYFRFILHHTSDFTQNLGLIKTRDG